MTAAQNPRIRQPGTFGTAKLPHPVLANSKSIDKRTDNPTLKPGVTAEDVANRLYAHKNRVETKLKTERDRIQRE